MSGCSDICEVFPAMTLEDDGSGKLKKEAEDGSEAPPSMTLEDGSEKLTKEVEEAPSMNLEHKLLKEEEVEDGSREQSSKKKKKKQEVKDGTQGKKKKQEVEDGTQGRLRKKKKKQEVKEEEWRKFLGVKKSAGLFSAQIRYPPSLGGYRVWLGTYKSPKVAALAYDQAAYKLHGSQATLNFPNRIRTSSDDAHTK